MKNYINKALLILLSGIILAGCDHDFADINTDPKTVYDINPINHFYVAALTMNNSSFEFYYDICGKQMPWMQYIVGTSGNGSTTYDYISNQGDRYSRFVSSGGYVKDIEEYIKANYTEAEQEKYRDLIQIARVLLIYYGIYASDTFGSLVYDEGWQARYGGITEPSFQSQEDLYNEWDNQLKNAINLLKQSGPAQVSIGGYDPVYGGKVQNWIKAANALRLRLATRWVKRDISKAKSIASEVLNADPGNLFTSNDDGWIFKFETNVAGHENYNRIASYKATYSMVDYMLKNNDPRLRMLYRKNNYTKENVDLWNVQNPGKQIVYNPQQYVGGHSNPDAVNVTTSPEYYAAARKIKQADGKELTLDTLSYTQERMFYPSFSNGTGIVWMPGISCADFCFMAAEFVTRGVGSSKTARQWYETGVESSIRLYSEMAGKAQVENYEAVKESEIKAYMQTSAVQWDASQALEKIASQAFIDYYKNVNEAMSLWKRTGFPNTVTPFPVEPLTSEGQQIVIPRRHSFTYPLPGTNNYENYKKRIDDMAKDPDFGEPIDATGRIWWDKK